MKYSMVYITVFVVGLLVWVSSAHGDSIYARAMANGGTASIYADDTARDVGDILTITIMEQSTVASDTSRSLGKKSSRKASMKGIADLKDVALGMVRGANALRFPDISYDDSYDSKFDGTGKFDLSRKVTDQITVAIEDVLPNGNLVVLGSRYREMAGEIQLIQISGIVRPNDIKNDNTITSGKIADFRLVVTIEGDEKRTTSQGWWSKLLDILNPF